MIDPVLLDDVRAHFNAADLDPLAHPELETILLGLTGRISDDFGDHATDVASLVLEVLELRRSS